MNDSKIVIKADNVYKDFRLPHEKTSTIKGMFTSAFKSLTQHKTIETQHALKNISFEVKKGEFFGIVGRNGSGKSTLLKILAGIYQPTKGSVGVQGKLVPFIELGVGFNPELSGKDNVFLNGALLGFSQQEVEAMYDEIVEFAELEQFMDQKLKNYSSGMQVRLAFSMAIRAKADVLLIDEVLAVGDADFQRKCFNYFNQLKGKGTTVVFVTHNMDAVREYCDRAMLIENNKIVDIGSTDIISEKYLRMFMENKVSSTQTEGDQKQDRWGDQAAVITDVHVDVASKTINILLNIKGNQDFSRPIAGFRLRDATGKEITGTNTKHESTPLPDLSKDKIVKVIWTMPNVLRDGEYTLDVAVQYQDEITVADWWNSAAEFVVIKKRPIPYTIDPGFKTTIG